MNSRILMCAWVLGGIIWQLQFLLTCTEKLGDKTVEPLWLVLGNTVKLRDLCCVFKIFPTQWQRLWVSSSVHPAWKSLSPCEPETAQQHREQKLVSEFYVGSRMFNEHKHQRGRERRERGERERTWFSPCFLIIKVYIRINKMIICWEAMEYLYLNRTKSSPHLLVQQQWQLDWFCFSQSCDKYCRKLKNNKLAVSLWEYSITSVLAERSDYFRVSRRRRGHTFWDSTHCICCYSSTGNWT